MSIDEILNTISEAITLYDAILYGRNLDISDYAGLGDRLFDSITALRKAHGMEE
jgi:hypothetical protein